MMALGGLLAASDRRYRMHAAASDERPYAEAAR
jgi:hypothetical protein